MSARKEVRTRGDGGDRAFVSALQALKQQGCALLVVGTTPDSVCKKACQQMLGDSEFSTRRRLYVATDRTASTACDLLAETLQQPDPTTVKVLSFTGTARSAAIDSQPSRTRVPVERVASGDLADLGIAISEAIAEFEAQEGGLAPAELRVCFDSLTPLVDDDRETLFQFLDLLNTRIRDVGGMGHMHLRTARNGEIVRLLEPLFDAVIELREKDGEPQQRWHLLDSDLRSGWITRD